MFVCAVKRVIVLAVVRWTTVRILWSDVLET